MLVHVLACDYDGTIALAGRVADTTAAALRRVRESGRRLVLVTGRMLDDLRAIFSEVDTLDLSAMSRAEKVGYATKALGAIAAVRATA